VVLAAAMAGFEVDITTLGGVGDGKTSNTRVFAEAVALIASKGGGRLVVPGSPSPGGAAAARFVTGPFNLTSHMVLEVAAGATLVGSINISEWPLMPPMPSCTELLSNLRRVASPLLSFVLCRNWPTTVCQLG
jgi:polygalacturonase